MLYINVIKQVINIGSIYRQLNSVNCSEYININITALHILYSRIKKIGKNYFATTNNEMLNSLPFFASGIIVRGFGRGSKELGIPTANFDLEVVKSLPPALHTGIYYGWANVDNGEVYKMVLSIGWNPFYDNKEKSMETHILHEFNRDLYGCLLKICIVGYLRPEKNFKSLDDLIKTIKNDIKEADQLLDADANKLNLKFSDFFKNNTKS